jgi:hypothetical protein
MEEWINQATWILVVLSLAGNVFVVRKDVRGQWIWAVSNTGWIAYNLWLGAIPQAALFSVYLGLCVWGAISWGREARANA